jgi:hypothetical protein
MRYRTIVAIVVLGAWFACGVAPAEETGDPWLGKSVEDVTAVLGRPDKVKEAEGVRTLVYKLMLPGDPPPLDPRIRLLQLPGVGRVARWSHQDTSGNEPKTYEPTHIDEKGRVVAGNYDTQSSASMSYNTKSGKVERNWEEGPDPGKVKKITLKVQVDAEGTVRDWSVSPKKYMKRD